MSQIFKRFPADTSLDKKTFLTDKKIDAELYAYLQSKSTVQENSETHENETRVYLANLDPVTKIIDILGYKSRSTYYNHLNYLKEKNIGLITDKTTYYILNNTEDFYLLIPLETLQFLLDGVSENTFKIYTYLGQRYNWKKSQESSENYVFDLQEIGEHIGAPIHNNTRNYKKIQNCLDLLKDAKLIDYTDFYQTSEKNPNIKYPQKRLTKFTLFRPK